MKRWFVVNKKNSTVSRILRFIMTDILQEVTKELFCFWPHTLTKNDNLMTKCAFKIK